MKKKSNLTHGIKKSKKKTGLEPFGGAPEVGAIYIGDIEEDDDE